MMHADQYWTKRVCQGKLTSFQVDHQARKRQSMMHSNRQYKQE